MGNWFPRVRAHRRRLRAGRERLRTTKEFVITSDARAGEGPGRALHGLRHPVLQQRLPVNNIIPDWNDLVYHRPADWQARSRCCTAPTTSPSSPAASARRRARPPARCNINGDAVGIKSIEHAIVDRAWAEGWITPQPAAARPARRSPSSAPARPVWRPPSSSRVGHMSDRVREERQGRRPAALRHSRLQDGQGPHRPRVKQLRPKASPSAPTSSSASGRRAQGHQLGRNRQRRA